MSSPTRERRAVSEAVGLEQPGKEFLRLKSGKLAART